MKKIKIDPTLKAGDYVYAYRKGIHRIVRFVPGCSSGYCVVYTPVLDSKYRPQKVKGLHQCDPYYVTKVDIAALKENMQEYWKEAVANIDKYLKE